MKIGIIGTHGVGKTTICRFLSYYLHKQYNTDMLIESVRPLAKEGLPINENTTLDAQEAILNYQKSMEIVFEEQMKKGSLKHIVLDRTVIDNYVYALNKFKEAEKLLYQGVKDWVIYHPYQMLFKVPLWSKTIVDDKFRSTDAGFQRNIDSLLNDVLIDLNMNYNSIPVELFPLDSAEKTKQIELYFDNYFKK